MYSRLRSRLARGALQPWVMQLSLWHENPLPIASCSPTDRRRGFCEIRAAVEDDPPRWVFRSREAAASRCSILSIIESVGGATPGPGNKAPCYPANTVIVVFITGPADDPLVVSSIHVCSSRYIPDEDRWFRERILIQRQLLNDGNSIGKIYRSIVVPSSSKRN